MLKGINPVLTGDLLKVLSDMGHGDEIVIADGNYPAHAHSTRRPPILIAIDDTVRVLDAILDRFPVDDRPNSVGYIVEAPHGVERPRQATIPAPSFAKADLEVKQIGSVPRGEFYARAKRAYAIVSTTDPRHYFCYVLRKGALPEPSESDVDDRETEMIGRLLLGSIDLTVGDVDRIWNHLPGGFEEMTPERARELAEAAIRRARGSS